VLRHNAPGSPRPTLVLAGDILELALATSDEVVKVLAQAAALLLDQFGEIIYVPGNHDHHVWEVARETQYLNYIRRLDNLEKLKPAWHTTKVFMDMQGEDRLVHGTLTDLVRVVTHNQSVEVLTAYPNFGLTGPGGRCLVFSHGHFIEPLYHVMSTGTSLVFAGHEIPREVDKLEAENFAWIDFFWSAMGRQREAGGAVERIYEASSDRRSLERLTDSLAKNLAQRYNLLIPWSDWLEEQAFKWLLRLALSGRAAGGQERQVRGGVLSAETEKGLRWYVDGPLGNQVRKERQPPPSALTVVFGHTHKPFERVMDFASWPGARVLNTGGWVVDTVEPRPKQGAVAVLIDEDLNAVSLRFYQEGQYAVRVEEPVAAGAGHSALFEHVSGIVRPAEEPWRSFGETAGAQASLRMDRFRQRLGAVDRQG
jgi:UDP-2,3-diacylglucosamine pyrophosphatase LpxH